MKRKLQEQDVAGITSTKYLNFVSLCKRYASQSSGFVPVPAPALAPSGSAPNRPRLYDHKADNMDLSAINVIEADTPSRRSGSRSSSPSTDRSHCYRCGTTDHYVSVCPVQPRPGSPPKLAYNIPVSKGWPGRKQIGRRSCPLRDGLE